jgi:DNA polymerase-3 subunit gamma/tau
LCRTEAASRARSAEPAEGTTDEEVRAVALALYRKYRPRTFAEVIGQEHVTQPLCAALSSGRLHHAYLFSGPRGCGKTSSARILARSLNCERGPTPQPCGECDSCRALAPDGAGSIDVIEIDAASHGGVDDARELRERAFFAPVASRFKVYVIDEAHMVSSAGFNALLKLVEEPPDYVKFVFATTEPEKVLGTIKSRTHHYPFRLIPPGVLRPYLEDLCAREGVLVEPTVFPLVVRAGAGSVRDSLSVLDQLIGGAGAEGVTYARAVALLGVTDAALLDEVCDALAAGDGAAAFATIDRVAEAGHDPRRFASDLLERLRDLIVLQQVPDAAAKGLLDAPTDQLERMSAQALRFGPATLARFAEIVHSGLTEMRGTTAPRLLLELIAARMLLPGVEDSTAALLQRIERMERRLAVGTPPDEPEQPESARLPVGAAQSPGAQAVEGIQSGKTPKPGRQLAACGAAASGAAEPGRARPDAAPGRGGAGRVPEPGGAGPDGTRPGPVPESGQAQPAGPPPNGMPAARTAVGTSGHSRSEPGADEVRGDGRADSNAPDPAAGGPPGPPAGSLATTGRSTPSTPPAQTPAAGGPTPAAGRPTAAEERATGESSVARPVGAPAVLDAAAVRRVWDEVLSVVRGHSQRAWAVVREATVRDVDGDTLVLVFRHLFHANALSAAPEVLTDAVAQVLGGRWQVRCEIAGGDRTPARPASSQPATPAESVQADDWPAPAVPGRDLEPEAARTGTAGRSPEAPASGSARSRAARPDRAKTAGAAASGPGGGTGGPGASAVPGGGGRTGGGRTGAAGRGAAKGAASQASGAPTGGAVASTGATARSAGTGAAFVGGEADEPPFDPDYDSPVRDPKYPGFDPGDEPLDEEVDPSTPRQSSEEQALRLLAEALGAEKIGESDRR